MKKITTLLLAMGIATISACATNEADMDAAKHDAEMAKDKTAMEAEKAEQMRMEASKKAEQEKMVAEQRRKEAEQERMEAEKKAEQMRMDAEEASAARADSAASDSSNLVSTCTHGNQTRIISVIYDNDATDTACEVTYEKSSGVQTLWTANTDREYCSERAAEFVQKQEGWGWSCTELK